MPSATLIPSPTTRGDRRPAIRKPGVPAPGFSFHAARAILADHGRGRQASPARVDRALLERVVRADGGADPGAGGSDREGPAGAGAVGGTGADAAGDVSAGVRGGLGGAAVGESVGVLGVGKGVVRTTGRRRDPRRRAERSPIRHEERSITIAVLMIRCGSRLRGVFRAEWKRVADDLDRRRSSTAQARR